MAAPHIAGLAALILQAKNKSIAPGLVRTLLMNTASPKGLNVAPDAGLEPTWRQGAGLAQVVDAVTTPTWVTPSKISLGEGSGGSARRPITNSGSTPLPPPPSRVPPRRPPPPPTPSARSPLYPSSPSR